MQRQGTVAAGMVSVFFGYWMVRMPTGVDFVERRKAGEARRVGGSCHELWRASKCAAGVVSGRLSRAVQHPAGVGNAPRSAQDCCNIIHTRFQR